MWPKFAPFDVFAPIRCMRMPVLSMCGADGRMAGVARTVRIHGDFLGVVRAIRDASAGEVLMIDAGMGETHGSEAPWPANGGMFGELLAMEAQRKQLAGMVIDGNVRDTATQRTLDIPIYARGVHPNAGTADAQGQHQITVQMAGLQIFPGDMVLGDDDVSAHECRRAPPT